MATPGRIVVFNPDQPNRNPHPAIVTKVNEDGTLNLTAFSDYYPYGSMAHSNVPERVSSQQQRAYTWQWPEYHNPEPEAVEAATAVDSN